MGESGPGDISSYKASLCEAYLLFSLKGGSQLLGLQGVILRRCVIIGFKTQMIETQKRRLHGSLPMLSSGAGAASAILPYGDAPPLCTVAFVILSL